MYIRETLLYHSSHNEIILMSGSKDMKKIKLIILQVKNKLNIDEFDVDDVLIYREDGFWYVEK